MRKKTPLQLYMIAGLLLLFMSGMVFRLASVLQGDQVAAASVRQGRYHLHVPLTAGTFYDRNLRPMNNTEETVIAVVSPTPDTLASLFAKLRDREQVAVQLQHASPFVCYLTEPAIETPNLRILHGKENASGPLPAQHLLGYRQNGKAAAGLERCYSEWLNACDTAADLTFTVNGRGEALPGASGALQYSGMTGGGIVTTLDLDYQRITEKALREAEHYAGAAIVLDCKTGEILASASSPVYDPQALAESLNDPQSPFLNRALAPYSVGSVFKLVTASAAIESGISDLYMYTCTGHTTIYGQNFRCHKLEGHGLLDMEDAMAASCNPYFISLSQILTAESLHKTASDLGFGKSVLLAEGFCSESGYLPTVSELSVDAEKANFSFGQGKLLATPIQVAAMTSCIANGGIYCQPRLVSGFTMNGRDIQNDGNEEGIRVLQPETASALQRMMRAVIYKSDKSNGKPEHVTAAGKTSTAQTGQTADDGTELCHAWMTGFFPAYHPQYTVTVLIENGGSGNQTAAPVFRQIIDEIALKTR